MLSRRSKKHIEVFNGFKDLHPNIKLIEEFNIGNGLFIDIYLPMLGIGIELDGAQHSREISFFHKNGTIDFNLQKLRDKKKNRLCNEKDVFLYRINYDDKRPVGTIIDDIFYKYSDFITDRIIEDI